MKKLEKPIKPLFLKNIKGSESIIIKYLKSARDDFHIKIKKTADMVWFPSTEMTTLKTIISVFKPAMKVGSARETKDGYYTITISYKT